MLDSLSVSMSLSVNVYESRSCPVISFPSARIHSLASTRTQVWAVVRARIRVGMMGNDVWALNHCSKCKSSKYASDSMIHSILSPFLLAFLSFALTLILSALTLG